MLPPPSLRPLRELCDSVLRLLEMGRGVGGRWRGVGWDVAWSWVGCGAEWAGCGAEWVGGGE